MKDALGRDLAIGDKVVFCFGDEAFVGFVDKFSPEVNWIWVEFRRNPGVSKGVTNRLPRQVIGIDKGPV